MSARARKPAPAKKSTAPKDHGVLGLFFPPLEIVRVGFVGLGGRGTGLLNDLLHIEGVEIKALCDAREANALRAQALVEKAGQPKPDLYARRADDYKRLCDRDDLDLVHVTDDPLEAVKIILDYEREVGAPETVPMAFS